MQDGPVYNHLVYTQDSNPTNPKPNPLTLTETLVRSLIRKPNQTRRVTHVNRHFASKVYNNFRWSAIDLHCPAYSQN